MEAKGKDKAKPSDGGVPKKRRLVLTKNNGPPPPPTRQTSIEESLREPINVKPLNSLPVINVDEGNEEEGGLVRKKRGRQIRMEGPTEFKARDFLDG